MKASTETARRRVQWGTLTPRTVEYEFDRHITELLEKLPGGADLAPEDLHSRHVADLRSINAIRTDEPNSRAKIEEALHAMLLARGQAWNDELRAAGSTWPTNKHWEQMATMAVVRAFLHLRTWGEFSVALLTKRLGDAGPGSATPTI